MDSSGNMYVADPNNHRIQKFDSSGTFVVEWGSSGSGDGQFYGLVDVAVDSGGNVYALESSSDNNTNACRIQKFTSSGTFITKWGSFGTGNGQFYYAQGLAVDSSGNVYVSESSPFNPGNRVQKFTSSGTFITKWGTYGEFAGQFRNAISVAIDISNNVYVADNHRIQKFTSSGAFVAKWGSSGTGDGQFNNPFGVAADTNGNVYVADSYNHRIQKFSSSGTFVAKWGSSGTGDGQFSYPFGVATDTNGNIYVADSNNHRTQKFSDSGTFLAKWGSYGTGNGQFNAPYGVAVDSSGKSVFVADNGNNRIEVFTYLPSGYNQITGQLLSGGNMRLSYVGIAGTNYALDRTFNLSPTSWQPQATNTAGAGGVLVFTNTPNAATNNFWRIRSVP